MVFSSCIRDPLFDTDEWWNGHWESIDTQNAFFSSGYQRNGGIDFYFSTVDTILSQVDFLSLVDYSDKEKWKYIETYDGRYMKILEIEFEKIIEIIGPANSKKELGSSGTKYMFKKDYVHPLISDTLMYGY